MNIDYDFDDDLLEQVAQDGMPRVRVYRPEGLQVVLGRGSKPDVELQLDACLEDGVAVLVDSSQLAAAQMALEQDEPEEQ